MCVEPDEDCTSTLALNAKQFFPNAVILRQRLEDLSSEAILNAAGMNARQVGLVVGGPPCQPFSKSAYWLKERRKGLSDPRAGLLGEFVRVVRDLEPATFILENVSSLLHPSHRVAFDRLLVELGEAGYACTSEVINAAEHGVPQKRQRVIVLGMRGGRAPTFPLKTHSCDVAGAARRPSTGLLAETARRAIGHLNIRRLAEPEERVHGKWAEHLRQVPPGMNYKHHTEWAGHPRPTFIAEKRYWSFLLKMHPNGPSPTIQASPGPWTGPFHWTSRRLRIPELAALQTFPTDYEFAGSRRSRMRQIGNAVPPLLAAIVANHLIAQMGGRGKS